MTDAPGAVSAKVLLDGWFRAGLRALDSRKATCQAVATAPALPGPGPAILAIGKASAGMLLGAVDGLASTGLQPGPGMVIGVVHPAALPVGVESLVADHPVPGTASFQAADRLGEWLASLDESAPLLVLISGGTSALIAAPLPGISSDELVQAFTVLQRSGLGITTVNAARRRLTRWSGGRLRAAIGARPALAYLVSDVPGDALATIGSGPLTGGTTLFDDVSPITSNLAWMNAMPGSVRQALRGPPPAGVPRLPHRVIMSAAVARHAVADAARAEHLRAVIDHPEYLGETTAVHAARLVESLVEQVKHGTGERLDIWSAEMTVTLADGHGIGGRCQQFALELGLALEAHRTTCPGLDRIVALVAGTDGRDGPTDAAGAWSYAALPGRIRALGFDPDDGARRRDCHQMLDRAGALYRTGPTGTNVADLVLVRQARSA